MACSIYSILFMDAEGRKLSIFVLFILGLGVGFYLAQFIF